MKLLCARPIVRAVLLSSLTVGWLRAGWSQPPQAGSSYAKAETLLRQRRWEEGIALLAPLIKEAPNDPRLLNLAGSAYSGKGDRLRGSEYFEQALRVSPEYVPALKNLAVNELATGRIDEAEGRLLKAEHVAPHDAMIQVYLGEIAYEKHSYPTAVRHLEAAGPGALRDPSVAASLAVSYLKSSAPGDQAKAEALLRALTPAVLGPRFQIGLGTALEETGQWAPALPYLEAARQAVPASPDLDYDLALAYLSVGKESEAISTLRAVVSGGHESAEIDNLLAEAYEKTGQTQAAVDSLRQAIALNPTDEDNFLDFASLCLNHQDYSNAAKVLAVGLAARPHSSRLIFERGILNAMQDHFDQAEKDFETSAELAPQDDSSYVALGVTYIETGDTKRAIETLRGRLREHPDDANLLYLLGEALIRSGAQPGQPAFTEAQAVTEASVRLNPDLSQPHVSLGTIYLKMDRIADAINQLEKARQIDPAAKSAYSHLAVAYRRSGQIEKSREMIALLQTINNHERGDPSQRLKSDRGTESKSGGARQGSIR